jgi:hypothetical protein
LRCAFGIDNDDATVPNTYHRFLVWDIEHPHRLVRGVERMLDPFMGKSIVFYVAKEPVGVHA